MAKKYSYNPLFPLKTQFWNFNRVRFSVYQVHGKVRSKDVIDTIYKKDFLFVFSSYRATFVIQVFEHFVDVGLFHTMIWLFLAMARWFGFRIFLVFSDVWMHWCLNFWMFRCMDFVCMDIWMHGFLDAWMDWWRLCVCHSFYGSIDCCQDLKHILQPPRA